MIHYYYHYHFITQREPEPKPERGLRNRLPPCNVNIKSLVFFVPYLQPNLTFELQHLILILRSTRTLFHALTQFGPGMSHQLWLIPTSVSISISVSFLLHLA